MTLKKLTGGIAFRLIGPLTVLVALVSGIFGYVNVHIQEEQLLDEVVTGADQLSRSIVGATWHAMLADRREAAYQVMRTIGEKQGIDGIRFFNKEGEVTFSTSPTASHVDKNAEACFMCHAREQPLVKVDTPTRSRVFSSKDGGRKLAMITPIYNEPSCSEAECHAHPEERKVLGVLDIALDIDHVDKEISGVKLRIFLMSLIQVALIAALIAVFSRRSVTGPIRKLIAATKTMSDMELEKPIRVHAAGELAELAVSFNTMRARLRAALEELSHLNQDLEHRVEERSEQLVMVQKQLIQSDKLASLGQLAASVAHEINNPVSGVLNFSVLMSRLVSDEGIPKERVEDFRNYLKMITSETTRVGRIVSDLLSFSRRSAPRAVETDLAEVIRQTVSLISHRLEINNVEMVLDQDPKLPKIVCDKSQIQQVLINLIMNGAEAIPESGTVTLRTRRSEEGVIIEVEDTGAGIPDSIMSRIFDPFVSTKEEGAGVGLGLSVVYGIVEAHKGHIQVKSIIGKGTVFTVTLPGGNQDDAVEGAVARLPGE